MSAVYDQALLAVAKHQVPAVTMPDSPFSLHNKVAVVTGASRGIGQTIAAALASAGARVALVGRDQATLDAGATELPHQPIPIVADVSNVAEIGPALAQVTRELNRLDILINNAGAEQLC